MADKQNVLTPSLPYPNHGNTVAAWGLTIVTLVGAIIAAIGFDSFHKPLMIAGGAVMVLGVIVGLVLRSMGYGQGGSKTKYKHH